jgi:hypothetical protein
MERECTVWAVGFQWERGYSMPPKFGKQGTRNACYGGE